MIFLIDFFEIKILKFNIFNSKKMLSKNDHKYFPYFFFPFFALAGIFTFWRFAWFFSTAESYQIFKVFSFKINTCLWKIKLLLFLANLMAELETMRWCFFMPQFISIARVFAVKIYFVSTFHMHFVNFSSVSHAYQSLFFIFSVFLKIYFFVRHEEWHTAILI